ncbi:Beta-1,3-galactosyltransferase 1 [Bulinus truncatus]|nr:Beta-1,3-galactosyltransferase 1 [Bulinus truncatus]
MLTIGDVKQGKQAALKQMKRTVIACNKNLISYPEETGILITPSQQLFRATAMFIKRIFTKLLPVTLFIFLILLYMNQGPGDGATKKLMETLRDLQNSQLINTVKEIERINANLSLNGSQSDGVELSITTRKWFNDRQNVSPSDKSPLDHPYFLGYHIENTEVCQDGDVDVLIYIQSAPEHREERSAIRETWGSPYIFSDINVKLIFIIGNSDDKVRQLQIETEYAAYGDIVQGDFMDSFLNLTYKAVTMLAWVNSHCAQAKYIMKADDDVFVDTYRVIRELVPQLTSKTLAAACDYKVNMAIPRNPKSKWYVPKQYVPERTHWPPFCSGYFTIFTGTMVPKLYEASFLSEDFVPGDDVYLFGLLPEQNVTFDVIDIKGQISPGEKPKAEEDINSIRKFQHLAFGVSSSNDHRRLWTLRNQVLSEWEKAHSFFHNTFQNAKEKGIILV